MKFNKNFLIWWLVLLIAMSFLFQSKKEENTGALAQGEIGIASLKTEFSQGKEVMIKIRNNQAIPITLPALCPAPPLEVFRSDPNGEWQTLTATAKIDCAKQKLDQPIEIEPEKTATVSFKWWNYALFQELGRYQVRLKFLIGEEEKTFRSNEFYVKEPGFLGSLWDNAFYRPIYNTLIFFAKIAPGHNLGIAIILVTILIRGILLIPSQKAMRSQRKLQEVQPRLEAIRKKYKDNQEKIAQETMAIWKEHKVNPFGSCLPLLIQFPVMIAVYYAVRNGLNPDSIHHLYESLKDFSLTDINTNFLGLDLTEINFIILPIVVGGLQFFQMKLAMSFRKKKQPEKSNKPVKKDKPAGPDMQGMNQAMMYFMPVMIAVFTASLPSGVGLYWGVSTVFGIGQQLVVNRESDKDKPKVKVIS